MAMLIRRSENLPEDQKLKELILYISRESETDETFGATKLNKILFFADFIAYATLGKSITGQEYQKLEFGPAPRRFFPVREELQEAGDLAVREEDYYGKPQKKTFALRKPDLSLFDAEEIALVDSVMRELVDSNGSDVSNLSHRFIGWQIVGLKETIPYSTVLIGRRELTLREFEHGLSLESMAEECLARTA